MAPMAPLGRDAAVKLIREGKLPIWFGSPHPMVMILEQDGVFRVRQLVIDQAKAKADNQAALAAGRSWMPEHYYALGEPTGTIYLEAPTREALIDGVMTMTWEPHW